LFECQPFLSNFVWSIQSNSCINYDILRWLWVGLSIPIDFAILSIPLEILKKTKLPPIENRVLKMVFAANLLGTITCVLGIYGVYENRANEAADEFYQETIFIMLNDIEILMYALGASFPVLSRWLVAKAGSSGWRSTDTYGSWWKRYLPNIVSSMAIRTRKSQRSQVTAAHTNLDKPFFVNPQNRSDISASVQKGADYYMSDITSYSPSKPKDMSKVHGTPDEEWGRSMWIDTVVSVSRESESNDPILRDGKNTAQVIGQGW